MPMFKKVSGVWEPIHAVYRNDGGTWKGDIHTAYQRENGTWEEIFSRPVIPVGLILPSTSGTVPAGWAAWTLGANQNIIGAGSTYAVGANGLGTGLFNAFTALGGGHLGASFTGGNNCADNGNKNRADSLEGGHLHTFNVNYTPPANRFPFMKAVSAGMLDLPYDIVAYTCDGIARPGLSNIWPSGGRILHNGAVHGAIGTNTYNAQLSNSTGTHEHGIDDSGDGSGNDVSDAAGAHTHTENILSPLHP